MSGIGRNDPCPCGSGRKYKKCCLAVSASPPGAYTKAESQSAWAALGAFTSRAEFAGDRAVAEASFFAPLAQGVPDELRRGLLAESQLFFEGWFLCDFLFRAGGLPSTSSWSARARASDRASGATSSGRAWRTCGPTRSSVSRRASVSTCWTCGRASGCQVEERLGSRQLAGWTMEEGEMTDTSPEVMERYRAMLLARSGAERLKMGASMNAPARALIRASVLAKDPHASPATLRRALFLRLYGHELDAATREKILARLGQDS